MFLASLDYSMRPERIIRASAQKMTILKSSALASIKSFKMKHSFFSQARSVPDFERL